MKILITGVSGFIGRNLVDYLTKDKQFTIYGATRNPERCTKLFGDKISGSTKSVTAEYLNQNGIETIIHLAGIAHDMSGRYRDEDYFKVNFDQTRELYDAFNHSAASNFIFISSIKAAVDFTTEAIDETIKPNPVTPYGKSKLQAEDYLQTHSKEGKSYFILRPCMVYGPGNKGNLNLLYKFIKRSIPYPLGAFTNRRSFLYIENLIFIIHTLMSQAVPSGIYHLSDGEYLSTNDVVKIIGEGANKPVSIWRLSRSMVHFFAKMGDVLGLFFNSHTLNKLTENLEVPNSKITDTLNVSLPFKTREALLKTVRDFK